LQRKIIFDIQFNPYWPKWQTKRFKLAAKDIETLEFHQDMWNRYLMLGFFWHIWHGTLYQISSYDCHIRYCTMTESYRPLRYLITFIGGNMRRLWMQLRSNCKYEIKLV
jgi:hypothetical protein